MKLVFKIIKESFKVLVIASVLSSIGGLALKGIEEKLILLLPFVIALPSLNGLVGDLGIIITSKFSTFLYERRIKNLKHSQFVRHLFREILPIALMSALYIIILALIVSYFKDLLFDISFILRFSITILISVFVLVLIIFFVAIIWGYHVYKKNENPDDILIPITTSIADLGSMIVFSLLIYLLF